MALSFTRKIGTDTQPEKGARKRVLVTGAAGNIGAYFAEHAAGAYDLRLMVRQLDDDARRLERFGEVAEANLEDLDELKRLCSGVHTVVHLAADPSPNATWQSLLQANIVGSYNMFAAAKAAGCRKVVYASSIHAVSGYPRDVQVKTTDPVNPGDLYGVSKCFAEALGRYYAEQEGLPVVVLRIGAFQPLEAARKGPVGMMDAFVSRRDLTALIRCCIDDETLQFGIFHGLSNNQFKRLDITDARELLGYRPQDDFAQENPQLKPLDLDEQLRAHNLQDPGQESGVREEVT